MFLPDEVFIGVERLLGSIGGCIAPKGAWRMGVELFLLYHKSR